MILPPELVDEILAHLQQDNQALQNCSLVAKSWTYPSQKLLYTHVNVTPSNYGTWQEIASPTSAKLLRHVHTLTCGQFQSFHDIHEDYLKSFHRLQRLSLHKSGNIESNIVDLFSAFRSTLSSLSLSDLSLTLDAFTNLLGYFPNLRDLRLTDLTFGAEHRTTLPPSTPLRGALSLFMCSTTNNTDLLLRGLCEFKLEYDELEIFAVYGNPSHVRSLISACEKTLTHLILGPHDSDYIHTLENLSELRKLTFTMSSLFPQEVSVISTITSTNIREIVFSPLLVRELEDQFWSSLDTGLSSLVDRLRASGHQHVLNVEFRRGLSFAEMVLGAGPDGFLPKFREKGRVILLEAEWEDTICSDGSTGSDLDSEDSEGPETI